MTDPTLHQWLVLGALSGGSILLSVCALVAMRLLSGPVTKRVTSAQQKQREKLARVIHLPNHQEYEQ